MCMGISQYYLQMEWNMSIKMASKDTLRPVKRISIVAKLLFLVKFINGDYNCMTIG